MNFRSLFGKIFGSGKNPQTDQAKLLNSFTNVYTPWDGNAYDDPTVRDCIDTIARHFGKMCPRHVVRKDGRVQKRVSDNLDYMLSTKPNPLMTTSEFLEKIAAQYMTYNNAFVYPQRDDGGRLLAVWPLNFEQLELREYQGELYCRFIFGTGSQTTVPYSSIVHIRRQFARDDIWGDDGSRVIQEDLSTLKAIKSSIVNAVQNFGSLRGILHWKQTLRPEDEQRAWQKFVDTYATSRNGSGIGSLDNKADFQQITTTVTTFNAAQMQFARDSIYRHFGLNDAIVTGKYTEDDYIAFYESVLEPIAVKLAQELTDKLFTAREKGFGNEIVMESNRLSYMSVASKIKVCQALTPIGCISVNEVREMFGYAGVPDGDKRQVSLNYVSTDDQSKYQVGNNSTTEGGDDNETNNQTDNQPEAG